MIEKKRFGITCSVTGRRFDLAYTVDRRTQVVIRIEDGGRLEPWRRAVYEELLIEHES